LNTEGDRPALAEAESLRLVAAIGIVAAILGRSLSPALRGASEGMDAVIGYADLLGNVATYLFALLGVLATLVQVLRTTRERRLGPVYRMTAAALSGLVVCLVGPALCQPLTDRANVMIGAASALVGLLAAYQALNVPRTRALAAALATAAGAALLHLGAILLAWYAGDRARYSLAIAARGVATTSVIFDTVAVLIILTWLATRNRGRTGWATRGVLLVACVITWAAGHGEVEGATLWQIVAHRGIERLLAQPAPYVWLPYRSLLEALAPLLALVAVGVRRQIPPVVAGFALILIARPTTDIPLSALAFTLAAQSTSLDGSDESGEIDWAGRLAVTSSMGPSVRLDRNRLDAAKAVS
jgi:hypothetical protein